MIAYLTHCDLLEYCFKYLINIPETIDIFVIVNESKMLLKIEYLALAENKKNIKCVMGEKLEQDLASCLMLCGVKWDAYEYFCFVHDPNRENEMISSRLDRSYLSIAWDNSIKNEIYIKNVISKFEENPALSVLISPLPYLSKSFSKSVKDGGKKERTFWCKVDRLRLMSEEQSVSLMFTEEYASIYLANYQYMLGKIIDKYII